MRDGILSQRTLLLEGRAEARAGGHAEGHAEGEKAKALAAAKILLGKNIAADIIAEATGLMPDEIVELHENDRP